MEAGMHGGFGAISDQDSRQNSKEGMQDEDVPKEDGRKKPRGQAAADKRTQEAEWQATLARASSAASPSEAAAALSPALPANHALARERATRPASGVSAPPAAGAGAAPVPPAASSLKAPSRSILRKLDPVAQVPTLHLNTASAGRVVTCGNG
jgi:hypothetical protein